MQINQQTAKKSAKTCPLMLNDCLENKMKARFGHSTPITDLDSCLKVSYPRYASKRTTQPWTDPTRGFDHSLLMWKSSCQSSHSFHFQNSIQPSKKWLLSLKSYFFDENETSYLDWKVVCVKQQLRFKLKTQFHKYLNSVFSWKLCFNNMKTTYSAWNYCIKCQKECFCRMESVIYALNCSLYKA